jgi:hypothetical protein
VLKNALINKVISKEVLGTTLKKERGIYLWQNVLIL